MCCGTKLANPLRNLKILTRFLVSVTFSQVESYFSVYTLANEYQAEHIQWKGMNWTSKKSYWKIEPVQGQVCYVVLTKAGLGIEMTEFSKCRKEQTNYINQSVAGVSNGSISLESI